MEETNPAIHSDDARSRYESIANDPKYGHFSRIPRRIVRCLDYFRAGCDKEAVERRLHAYYIFIGVIDHAIDSGQANIGQIVLRELDLTRNCAAKSASMSEVALATERLRTETPPDLSSEVLNDLRVLNATVEQERIVTSMVQYIETRKFVGRLTARISFVLIRPLIAGESDHIRRFMERVGEIGCLVDSVIDLRADGRAGLLNFRSTPLDVIRLLTCTIRAGAKLSIEYPLLLGLFFEAVADNVLDRLRARSSEGPAQVVSKSATAIS